MPKPVYRPAGEWRFIGLTDLNAVDPLNVMPAVCDRCNRQLRFIHQLEHSVSKQRVGVGACCAVRLATGYDAKAMERETTKRTAKLLRFVNPARWKQNASKGTLTRKLRGDRVTVFPQGIGYNFVCGGQFGGTACASAALAMIAAFDHIQRTVAT